MSVPSVRSRLVWAKSRSKWRRSSDSESAVSSWRITSGPAALIGGTDGVRVERIGDRRLGAELAHEVGALHAAGHAVTP